MPTNQSQQCHRKWHNIRRSINREEDQNGKIKITTEPCVIGIRNSQQKRHKNSLKQMEKMIIKTRQSHTDKAEAQPKGRRSPGFREISRRKRSHRIPECRSSGGLCEKDLGSFFLLCFFHWEAKGKPGVVSGRGQSGMDT